MRTRSLLRRRIGYVIQEAGLLPSPHRGRQRGRSCRELLGWDASAGARARPRAAGAGRAGPRPLRVPRGRAQLSGGERQRVGLARALGADPPLLLMDEPFGALDPLTRRRLQDEFKELQRRLGKTVVLVTHDVPEALRLGDEVAVMDAGRVLQRGHAGGDPRRAASRLRPRLRDAAHRRVSRRFCAFLAERRAELLRPHRPAPGSRAGLDGGRGGRRPSPRDPALAHSPAPGPAGAGRGRPAADDPQPGPVRLPHPPPLWAASAPAPRSSPSSLYALLPILRNTYAGILQVDPAVVEAATGLGMTDGQRLRRVELPLALPVILAGVRIAAVVSVGTATIAAAVGAGGLGDVRLPRHRHRGHAPHPGRRHARPRSWPSSWTASRRAWRGARVRPGPPCGFS